ncbi:UNVERIFIED_CONTAM: hypothetical protein K2H54_063919, partial [Gekko kuhli]
KKQEIHFSKTQSKERDQQVSASYALEKEVDDPQNKSKGERQEFPLGKKQQRRNNGTEWKSENESSSSQGAESQVQEEITQERYPEATFPGGAMKPAIDSSPSLVKPEQ